MTRSPPKERVLACAAVSVGPARAAPVQFGSAPADGSGAKREVPQGSAGWMLPQTAAAVSQMLCAPSGPQGNLRTLTRGALPIWTWRPAVSPDKSASSAPLAPSRAQQAPQIGAVPVPVSVLSLTPCAPPLPSRPPPSLLVSRAGAIEIPVTCAMPDKVQPTTLPVSAPHHTNANGMPGSHSQTAAVESAGLKEYFAKKYASGRFFSGHAYKHKEIGSSEVLFNAASGVSCWRFAIDVRLQADDMPVVLFHFLSEQAFHTVTCSTQPKMDLWEAHLEDLEFGLGLYTTSKEPSQWGSQDQIVVNNFWSEGCSMKDTSPEAAFEVGDACEGRALNDEWYPVKIIEFLHMSGYDSPWYKVEVHDGHVPLKVWEMHPANVRAIQRSCPAGHKLSACTSDAAGTCNGCGARLEARSLVADCRPCNLYLCATCHPQTNSKRHATEAVDCILAPHAEAKHQQFLLDRFAGRAAFCIPIICSEASAYDVLRRPTPEMTAGSGFDRHGIPQPSWRDIWLVRLWGDRGVEVLRSPDNLPEIRLRQIDMATRRLGPDAPSTLAAMGNLAAMLGRRGDLEGAEALECEVLQTRSHVLGPEHAETLTAKNNLAITLYQRGDLAGAAGLQQEVMQARESSLGPEHPETLAAKTNVAGMLFRMGQARSAEAFQAQALEGLERAVGSEHPYTTTARVNLEAIRRRLG